MPSLIATSSKEELGWNCIPASCTKPTRSSAGGLVHRVRPVAISIPTKCVSPQPPCEVATTTIRPSGRQRRPSDLLLRDLTHRAATGGFVDRDDAVLVLDRIIPPAGRDHEPAVARECQESRPSVPAARADDGCQDLVPDELARRGLPHPNLAVAVTRDDPIARGRPRSGRQLASGRPFVGCSRRPVRTSKTPTVLSIAMATRAPSGEKAGGFTPRPGQGDRSLPFSRRGVEDSEHAEIAHRHMQAVARQGPIAEAVVLVTVVVCDALTVLDVPEPDLAHRHVPGTILELRLLDQLRGLPDRHDPAPIGRHRDEVQPWVPPSGVTVCVLDPTNELPILDVPDGDRRAGAGPDNQPGSVGSEGQMEGTDGERPRDAE